MFTTLIDTPAKTKLATFFLSTSGRVFHPEEVRRAVGEPGPTIALNLRQMAKSGFLRPVERKSELYYAINPRYPYLEELRGLLLRKPVRYKDTISRELERLNNCTLIVLTGIFTGELRMPTDMVIVGSPGAPALKRAIGIVEKEIRQPINYTVFSNEEFEDRVHMYERFTRDLFDNSHVIVVDRRVKTSKFSQTAKEKNKKDKKKK